MKSNPLILNRASGGVLPKDGWHQIEVTGEHPAITEDGRRLVEVIDNKALDSIVADFEKEAAKENFAGLLVDPDHHSHDEDKSTEAMGWLMNVEVRDGELWGQHDWSDTGEAAVRGKRFKFFSTEYDEADLEDLGNGRVRPLRLAGLALTNRPNNKGGKPITNREGKASSDNEPTQKPTEKQDMNAIAEKLGLPETATEAEVLAKLGEVMAENEKLKGEVNEAEAEVILNTHRKRIPEGSEDEWRKGLIANREQTEALLKGLPEVDGDGKPGSGETRKPQTNREKAGQPDFDPNATDDDGGDDDEDKGAKQKAAVLRIKNRDKCTNTEAWRAAKLEEPKLFS